MPSTAQVLIDACFADVLPPPGVIFGYFGNAVGREQICSVLGIYQGLVKFRGVKHDLLFNCFLSNRLNDLVHAKYMNSPTGYYKLFCASKIDLKRFGKSIKEELWMPIYDDDHCPGCNTIGYRTKDLGFGTDCSVCYNMLCENCYGHDSKCKKCSVIREESEKEKSDLD